ncbi:MAG: hypothetical protein LBQ49_01735 [Rickettsiales bacterium]|jgi:hypothetical protein|nr:hypothetical protein [Rickettsiales bacterium]
MVHKKSSKITYIANPGKFPGAKLVEEFHVADLDSMEVMSKAEIIKESRFLRGDLPGVPNAPPPPEKGFRVLPGEKGGVKAFFERGRTGANADEEYITMWDVIYEHYYKRTLYLSTNRLVNRPTALNMGYMKYSPTYRFDWYGLIYMVNIKGPFGIEADINVDTKTGGMEIKKIRGAGPFWRWDTKFKTFILEQARALTA